MNPLAAEAAERASVDVETYNRVELNGTIVGCRRDTKELFTIEVRANRVRTKLLRPGLLACADRAPLPYEQEIDRWAAARRRRRMPTAEDMGVDLAAETSADVIDLARRRV